MATSSILCDHYCLVNIITSGKIFCDLYRGRSWSRRLDDKCGFLKRSTALHVARAGPKQDGPSGDGLSSSKPSVEKNGSSFHPEVNKAQFAVHSLRCP